MTEQLLEKITVCILSSIFVFFLWRGIFLWLDVKSRVKAKWMLFAVMGMGLPWVFLLTYQINSKQIKDPQFCGSCHIMSPYLEDLKNPQSENLATKHIQNRWIEQEQCYHCHSNYNLFGGADSKLRGLKHIYYNFTRSTPQAPQLYSPFPNENCLHCHLGTRKFESNPAHVAALDAIKDNTISCLECHRPAHPIHPLKKL